MIFYVGFFSFSPQTNVCIYLFIQIYYDRITNGDISAISDHDLFSLQTLST